MRLLTSCVLLLVLAAACSKDPVQDDEPDQRPDTSDMRALDMRADASVDTPDLAQDMTSQDMAKDMTSQDMAQDMRADAGPTQPEWVAPTCAPVAAASFTYSPDAGKTITPRTGTLSGQLIYTSGLITLAPNILLGTSGSTLTVSRDAGCTWQDVGMLTGLDYPALLVAGPQGRALAHAPNSPIVYRIDVTDESVTFSKTSMPEREDVLGVGTHPADPDTLYVGTVSGQIHLSTDGGQSFAPQGSPADPLNGGLAYTMKFDPSNPQHVVYGMAGAAMVTFDGGETWEKAAMASVPDGRTNVFAVSIHPTDGDVVWAMGIDIAESLLNPLPSHNGRHIYRSQDGGKTFAPVLDQREGVTLVNGPFMLADPADKEGLYFIFEACFQNYGTDIFRLSADGMLETIHHDVIQLSTIAVSPANPQLLYLGITREDRNGPGSGCGG